ncbi:response regulator transcription factor [Flavivirga sp. Y03]|uniref:Response regulator transcription factor n=2 Tax=Flavivirga algicola TaxID=2729136 RepID=A0ABX1S4B4_9FLAO|nr:response regulator transcription factor [Flavivirga algicola]
MILVALTTPLNMMAERQHKIPRFWKKLLFVNSILLFLATCIAFYINSLAYVEYIIVSFLAISVILSMIWIIITKPKQSIKHKEKSERIFAIIFLVIIPLSILGNYVFVEIGYNLKIGFTLPLIFILLAGDKLIDDIQRLSLFKPRSENKEQHFKNYSITEREKEVALLLIEGKAYKQISEQLYISIPTVKTHTSTIYKKCNVKNRTELAALLLS